MEFIAEYSSESDLSDTGDAHENKRKNIESNGADSPNKKRAKPALDGKIRLPPPSGIQSMFDGSDECPDEDTVAHGGKIRTFRHERGNWASLIYAPIDEEYLEWLSDLTESIISELRPVGKFQPCDDVHISLSRTFVLRHHWIDPFRKSLCARLQHCHRSRVGVSEVEVYCNDEKTRTFIAIGLVGDIRALAAYVKCIDSSLEEYRLPKYYENPSFHVSLAWVVGDVSSELTDKLKTNLQKLLAVNLETCDSTNIEIEHLCCKTGNKIFKLPLPAR